MNLSNLVARITVWPVLLSRTCQSRRILFFPDAATHVSTSTTSSLKITQLVHPKLIKDKEKTYRQLSEETINTHKSIGAKYGQYLVKNSFCVEVKQN